MAALAERQPIGTNWHCYSDFVHCQHDHLLLYHEYGFRGNRRHLNGPELFECRKCTPSSFFIAVFVSKPSPMAFCYALAKESYVYWDAQEEFPEIPELLHRLRDPEGRSHNPYWRVPRPREKR